MDNLTKLNVLDECVDGNVDKLDKLLGSNSEHFDVFYALCKTANPRNISSITFSEEDDSKVSFLITTNKSKKSSELFNEVDNCNVEMIPIDTRKLNVVVSVHSY